MKYFALALLLITQSSYATQYTVEGKVDFVRVHNPKIMGKNNDWVALQGVSSLGQCRSWDGHVVFRLTKKMNRAYDSAIKAQLNQKTVVLSVDDAIMDDTGACFVRWLNIKN